MKLPRALRWFFKAGRIVAAAWTFITSVYDIITEKEEEKPDDSG